MYIYFFFVYAHMDGEMLSPTNIGSLHPNSSWTMTTRFLRYYFFSGSSVFQFRCRDELYVILYFSVRARDLLEFFFL